MLVVLTLSFVGLLAAVTFSTSTQGFARLEEVTTNRDVARVVDALNSEVDNLARVARDYAVWDDTFAFMQDVNEEYSSQFTEDVISNLAINLLAFVRTAGAQSAAGDVIYIRNFDYNKQVDSPLSESVRAALQTSEPLLAGLAEDSRRSGLLHLPEGDMLVAAQPVLTNDGTGPTPGFLVVGRWLDQAELDRLGTLLKVNLSTFPSADPELPTDLRKVLAEIQAGQKISVNAINNATIAGYTLLPDLTGQNTTLLRVYLPRDTYLAQQTSLVITMSALLIVGMLAGIVALFFVKRTILNPLAALKTEIMRISPHMSKSGVDSDRSKTRVMLSHQFQELDLVADSINRLLDNLEAAAGTQRRLVQIRTAAEISRKLNTVLDINNLLQSVVDLVCDRFNLYYAGVFLLDDENQYAILKAGTGEAGKLLTATNHKLEIGGNSMVGWAISTRQARIALDTGKEAVRFNNPLLPYTRSEMALPIMTGERVIGALTVQSSHPGAFDQDDITVLQGIADSLAIAMENARLFTQAQHDFEEIRSLHRQYISASWSELSSDSEARSFTFDNFAEPGGGINEQPPQGAAINLPLRLRDQVIGSLMIETDKPFLTEEEQSAAQAVADQAALALENARLLESTRLQVEKQRLIASISNQTWSSADIESILRHAMQELGESLSASQGWVQLEINDLPENMPA